MPISGRSSCATGSSWLLAVGMLAVSGAGCADSNDAGERLNVVLICLDTVRADHLGAYGYDEHPTTPFLDELASRSYLFANAYATAGWTKPSVPSFFTGTYPCQHGVYEGSARLKAGAVTDVLPDEAHTLAEVFAENGYRTAAFVRNAQLRPGNGFEQGFETYRDQAGDAREIRWRALDWLDEGGSERPFFLYLHFLDAHWPYAVPDEYAARFASLEEIERFRGEDARALRDAINDGDVPFGDADRAALERLYDGALRYLDDELRRLAQGLELRGEAERTIVCVVSDHGEEFGEHGRIGHGHGLWEGLLRVPWILHVPGHGEVRVDAQVSLVDLYPTLLRAARLPIENLLPGVDRLADPELRLPIFAEHKAPDRYLQSLRDGDRKILRDFSPPVFAVEQPHSAIAAGQRWEAELRRSLDGSLRATQLKPRDESPEDPVELKGQVENLFDTTFLLGGFRIRTSASTRIQVSEGAPGSELRNGLWVKLRGAFEGGEFQASWVKIYGPDAEETFELRGPVEAFEEENGVGRIRLAGQWIGFDRETAIKGGSDRPRMKREDVHRALEIGGAGAGEAGYTVETVVFDLHENPEEAEASAMRSASPPLLQAIDEWGKTLIRRRIYAEGDRRVLSREALDGLRAIGYVE